MKRSQEGDSQQVLYVGVIENPHLVVFHLLYIEKKLILTVSRWHSSRWTLTQKSASSSVHCQPKTSIVFCNLIRVFWAKKARRPVSYLTMGRPSLSPNKKSKPRRPPTPPTLITREFTEEEIAEFKESFSMFDLDGGGEWKQMLD